MSRVKRNCRMRIKHLQCNLEKVNARDKCVSFCTLDRAQRLLLVQFGGAMIFFTTLLDIAVVGRGVITEIQRVYCILYVRFRMKYNTIEFRTRRTHVQPTRKFGECRRVIKSIFKKKNDITPCAANCFVFVFCALSIISRLK